MRQVGPLWGRSLGEMRVLLRVDELHHIMSSLVFREYVTGALDELEQVGGRIDVLGGVIDCNRLAAPLVVALLSSSREFLAAYPAHVLAMLGATLLVRYEGPRG